MTCRTLEPPARPDGASVGRTAPETLSHAEELRMVCAAQSGDGEARERLLYAHLPLIRRVARTYRCHSLAPEDLVQEGILGFFRGLQLFEPKRGLRLSTYVIFWVRQFIGQAVYQRDTFIRYPSHMRGEVRRVFLAREAMRRDQARDPDAHDLADACGLPIETVRIALRAYDRPVSLDAPVMAGSPVSLGDAIEDPQAQDPLEATLSGERVRQVRRALQWLSPRERAVLEQRYGLNGEPPRTLEQVSSVLGLSREGIRQTEIRAIRRLRHTLHQWQGR